MIELSLYWKTIPVKDNSNERQFQIANAFTFLITETFAIMFQIDFSNNEKTFKKYDKIVVYKMI